MTRLFHNSSACKAQLSLEYLLLLSAFFSVLLLLMPLVQKTYALALFGFDVRQAVSFSKEFAETVAQLSVLSDNSSLSIEARPLHEWAVSAKGKKFAVSVRSESLGKTKTIETTLVSDLFFEKVFSEKTTLVLRKENALLAIDSYP